MLQRIPENVEEDSGECSRGFRRMFQIIPGNFQEDSEECLKRFWGMFEEIQGNAHEGSGECLKADSRVEWPNKLISQKLYAILKILLNH